MFYSERPIEDVWSKEDLFKLTIEGPWETMMGETYIESISDEYEFSVLAKNAPFEYRVIWEPDKP